VRRRDEFIEQVRGWATAQPDVQAALLVGSAARSDTPADRWSDVDIGLFVDDIEPYARDATWLAPLGTPLLTFVEPTAVGGSVERRVLFEDGIEADFALFPVEAVEQLRADPGAGATLLRGYRILVDRVGLESLLERTPEPAPPVTPAQLEELASDVWYHALWAAKKLRRGELWVARSCVDCYLQARLVEIAALDRRVRDPDVDTWHRGRFLERWADEDVVAELWSSLSRGPDDVAAAIRRTVTLFDRIADELAVRLGVPLKLKRDEARTRLDALLAPPQRL
jgi:aminoglycoside 6-adenylyltransferase